MQTARKLHRRAVRDRERAFLIEGPLAVAEALDSEAWITEVFIGDAADGGEVEKRAVDRGVTIHRVAPNVIRALGTTVTSQGVVAVARMPGGSLGDLPDHADLVVVLAGVRDPGNAGTILRSAVGAGASAVVFATGSVDPYHPKTVRASAGNLFRISVIPDMEAARAIEMLKSRDFSVLGTAARASTSVYDIDLTGPVAFVLGNEAWGMVPEVEQLLDAVVGIPLPGPIESLNVGIAGSVLLFEAARQRRDA